MYIYIHVCIYTYREYRDIRESSLNDGIPNSTIPRRFETAPSPPGCGKEGQVQSLSFGF